MSSAELEVLEYLNGHKDEVKGLKVVRVSGKEILYSSSKDKKVFSWDLHSKIDSEFGKILKLYEGGHSKRINGIDVSKDGSMMVTVGSDGIGRIWDTEAKKSKPLEGHSRDVLCVSINSNDTKIVSGSVDRTMNLYNTRGELIAKIGKETEKMHRGWINCVAFHPIEENILASGSTDGTVKIWDLDAPEHMQTYLGGMYVDYEKAKEKKVSPADYDESKSVTAMAFSKDGSILTYGEKSGKVYLVKLDSKECIQSLDTLIPVRSIAVGETEPVIALGTDESVIIWETISSRIIANYNLKEIGNGVRCLSLAFSGNTLYCGLSSGTIVPLELRKSD
ncbi:WD40 domain-containing putative guanine nucleotide binding protein [Encephalitozoon intestinalis ATCC 50506]|uniref:WD40 domain-containing putative guanine nucleotide binding protein n=1 Tax=Encephalitozoon intestinalis (strain ATCC 50506) TaxID=876142 RepID=E0S8S6_ENCIT|nr:WD40 domain-containing putative guanine nucleotide binding protein [Encephalitozoon intestinalis ATCC 50506]ADM12043.1 WD40 domain-containing putative guanine nucleotide binding protein [Encephalitozoon intestinalis ATCC 50506]UTX45832.1 WD40 domain-containing protein [Encephalitozoon intestinalis]